MPNSKIRCSTCKQYVPREEAIKRGFLSYCSEECLKPKQKSSGKPKGGHVKTDLDPELRRKIHERDGHRCRWCGGPGGMFGFNVHHIAYKSEGVDNSEQNLILLCTGDGCHEKAHSNKKLYQALLRETIRREYEESRWQTVAQVEYEQGMAPTP